MDPNLYVGLVMPNQVESFHSLLTHYPKLNDLFGADWLDSIAQVGSDSSTAHPLFWHLSNPSTQELLAESVLLLKTKTSSYGDFIAELKSTKDERKMFGLIREVEAYYELRKRGVDVVWKPKVIVGIKTVSPDLLINADVPIYLEIFTIADSDASLEEEKASQALQAAINKLENNPFWIWTNCKVIIGKEHIEPAIKFLQATIPTIRVQDHKQRESRSFAMDGRKIIRFDFQLSVDGKGKWMGGGGPVRSIDTSSRVKNKILDKIQAFQLPPKGEGKHLNGYLIFLEPLFYDVYGVVAAVKGQHTLSFPLPGAEGEHAVPGHLSNGVIHHNYWGEEIAKNLDFIASSQSTHKGILKGESSSLLVSESIGVDPFYLRNILFDASA